MKTINMKS